jgi:hypothetical protein
VTGTAFRICVACRVALVVTVTAAASACAWQPYVATRTIRHFTGNPTRFHSIVPLTASLKRYRVVEVTPLQNLLDSAIPAATKQYIDQRVVDRLRSLPAAPHVIVLTEHPLGIDADAPAAAPVPGAPTLRVDGFIDDFDAGSLPLRLAELGFNHVAVTVRIRLRDKATSQIIGAASFTAQDDRITASTTAAINHVASRIGDFVESGYER